MRNIIILSALASIVLADIQVGVGLASNELKQNGASEFIGDKDFEIFASKIATADGFIYDFRAGLRQFRQEYSESQESVSADIRLQNKEYRFEALFGYAKMLKYDVALGFLGGAGYEKISTKVGVVLHVQTPIELHLQKERKAHLSSAFIKAGASARKQFKNNLSLSAALYAKYFTKQANKRFSPELEVRAGYNINDKFYAGIKCAYVNTLTSYGLRYGFELSNRF